MLEGRIGDGAEVKELRGRLRTMVGKLAAMKKEKEAVARQKEELEREVGSLQVSLRHAVAGFSNSSSSFPMGQELVAKVAEFYKYDCLDTFFDLLAPEELTLKGIIFFYLQAFTCAAALVDLHFQPALAALMHAGCLSSLDGPVLNVLRKAFQTRHLEILQQLSQQERLSADAEQIIDALGLGGDREEAVSSIAKFLGRLVSIVLECRISDPPFVLEIAGIGKRAEFNSLVHDPFDGFIRGREECFVILPELHRAGSVEVLTKSLVLHRDYDPAN